MGQSDNERKIWTGFWFGLMAGSLVAFFRGPRLRLGGTREGLAGARDKMRDTLESVTPSDPIKDSIKKGKEAARRRRSLLGLSRNTD